MRIIFFDIDCLRPDHLSCYGYNRPTSPNLDRIAQNGVRFNHCYCSSSPCLPSRTAWSSGRFGFRNGVTSNHSAGADFHLRCSHYGGPRPDNEMVMRQLRRLGLDTVSISNFADRHSAYYFMAGFSEFITPNLKGGGETAPEVNAKALDWLTRNKGRDDYLLHINYWDTHRTYRMDPKWSERLEDTKVDIPWPDEEAIKKMHREVTGPFTATGQFKDNTSPVPLMPGEVSNRAEFEQMVTAYDTSIAYVDHHVGEVLALLEQQGLMDDTAVIISSDHGDAFGEHGIYTDHVCADECIHNIPLIVSWPGVTKAGHGDDSFIYNLDLGPTLCDLLGGETPGDWDGASFRSNLQGDDGLDRDYLVWDHGLYTLQRAVRTKTHLMIRTYDDNDYSSFDPIALYDMTTDPYQTRNLAEEDPAALARCEQLLNEWTAEQLAKGHVHQDPLMATLGERQVD